MKRKRISRTGGFTLVELVVVIAILGILAGAGAAGYSGYVKNANKNADKVLVGNIIRAIETGTNSYAFVSDDSFEMGKLSYPVGIITLSTDGCSIKESTSTVKKETTECSMVDATFYKVTTMSNAYGSQSRSVFLGYGEWGIEETKYQTYYKLEQVPVRYCENHMSLPNEKTYKQLGTSHSSNYIYLNMAIANTGYQERVSSGTYYDLIDSAPVINIDDCVGIYAIQDESTGHGTSISREELEALPTGNRIANSAPGEPLYDALEAAFGSDFSSMKLKYPKWTTEEGLGYSSTNSYMSEAYTELKKIANIAADQGLIGAASSAYFGKNWETPEAAMDEGVRAVHTMYGNNEEAWLNAWKNAADEPYNGTGFGMNTGNSTADKVGYNALRMQYNQAFASYLITKNVPEQYVNVIVKFDSGVAVGDVYLPAVVNKSAFEVDDEGNNASKLKDKLKSAGDSDGTWFEKIHEYYNEYLESPAYNENAKSVMAMNSTMAENGAAAMKYGDGYMAYFQNYIDEMDAYYTAAENAAGDGIVIIVSVEDGVVKCDVSPSAANPRNK